MFGYIDPTDPYPTDPGGNALNIDTAFLTPAQIACLMTPGCSVSTAALTVRDPVTGEILNPATGQPYNSSASVSIAGVQIPVVWLLLAAALAVYLIVRRK